LDSQKHAASPLVVVASEKEGMGLVKRLGLRRDPEIRLPGLCREKNSGLYCGDKLNLAITGVYEHNMTAAVSLVLHHANRNPLFVLNFGAAGLYAHHHVNAGLTIGDMVHVQKVCRFDLDDNVHWAPSVDLRCSDACLPKAVCVTGSRYSTENDRRSPYFPKDGQIEDMELYGLAVLLQTHKIPLISIKVIANLVVSDGRQQMRNNLSAMISAAEERIISAIDQEAAV